MGKAVELFASEICKEVIDENEEERKAELRVDVLHPQECYQANDSQRRAADQTPGKVAKHVLTIAWI